MTINFIFTLFCLNNVSILIFSDINVNFLERSLLRFWGWSRFSYLLFVDIGNCLRLIADKFTLGINISYCLLFICFKVSSFARTVCRISGIFFWILCFNKFKAFFIYLSRSVSFFFSSANYSFSATFADYITIFVLNSINMSFFERSFFRFWDYFFFNFLFVDIGNC
ncbi:hypothetical protein FC42_GL000771 [Lactobacillus iners DSM 13335]|nr:hypothetical protein FC42_GL000771 [Lactobacillus iners DSM 13335]